MRNLVTTLLLLCLSGLAQAGLNIFACEPEWGSLAQELAAPDANIHVATTAQQDPHHIQARPSLLARVRRADLLVCNGADLEIGWLPVLLNRAGNPKVQPGQPGHFLAAEQVALLDIPVRVDRSEGDVHPDGNPHILLDPDRLLAVGQALSARLQLLDPDHTPTYQQRLTDFESRWKTAMRGWQQRAVRLQGLPVVVGHSEWRYLQAWTGMRFVAQLEERPGIPPSSNHLAHVLQIVEQEKPVAVLTAPGRSKKGPQWLNERSGLPVITLPFTVGGNERVKDLFALFDDTLNQLERILP